MESLESILTKSLMNKKDNFTTSEICSYAEDDFELFSSTLFNCINKIIDNYPKDNNLYEIDKLFYYLDVLKEKANIKDIEYIKGKLTKLDKRIENLKNKIIKNKKKSKKKISVFQEELNMYKNTLCIKDNRLEDDFIDYITSRPIELKYIDIVFEKMPDIMEVKDKYGISLYRNIISKYIHTTKKEEVNYYKNLILLINSKKSFKITKKEQNIILNDLYNMLNEKDYKNHLNRIKEVKDIVENNINNEINNIARKYNININFNEEVLNKVQGNLRINKNRTRINDYILSIDSDKTNEIDDALSCIKLENGNYILGVHIASILGYFSYESDIVQNAFNRVHSIYFHNKKLEENNVIPIFPKEFAFYKGSLIEGQDRLTRSYMFEIDKNGEVVNECFLKTIINNNKQTTYDKVNKIIEKGSSDSKLEETVNNLLEVTKLLNKKNKIDELYEIVKENSIDTSNLKVKQEGSEQIVYQSMLLTGKEVAKFFKSNNYPCLYRVHYVDEKTNKEIQKIINSVSSEINDTKKDKIYDLINSLYPKSMYDIEGPHDGLNLDSYCHCTSCLRRSPDILVEHALEVCYDKKPTNSEINKLQEEILSKKDLINEKNDVIDWFVKDVNKTLILKKR